MKKPKINLGAGALKGLLVQHVEKLAFGFAVLLVFVFIVLGYRLDSDLDGKTPDSLKTLALNAVSNIERPTHQKVESDRTPRNGQGGQYFTRLIEVNRPPNPEVYSADKPWSPPLGRPGGKRVDPEIYPPIRLETAALTGALCVRPDGATAYPLDELPNAPMPEERPRRTRPTRGREDATDLSGAAGTVGKGPSADGTPGGKGAGKTRGTKGRGGMPEDPLPLFGKEGDSTRDRGDKRRKEDTAIGPMRVYPAHLVCGYRPGDTGTTGFMPGSMMERKGIAAGGTKGLPPGADSGQGGRPGWGAESGKPIVQSVNVIAVKALAPYRKQADEFKRALGEAIGFDPVRDRPKLVFFQAQRADVTDDPDKELADSDWKMIRTPTRPKRWPPTNDGTA